MIVKLISQSINHSSEVNDQEIGHTILETVVYLKREALKADIKQDYGSPIMKMGTH